MPASIPDWVTEEELAVLSNAGPATVMKPREAEEIAMRLFRDNLPLAVHIITDVMVNSESEKNRFAAAKYVVERTMGKTPDARPTETGSNPWDELLGSVIREPSLEERNAGVRVSRI